jgi:hypothetical protein
MIRTEPCLLCGGVIVADPDDPGPAVLAHVQTPRHRAARLGYVLEDVRPGFATPDGLPVVRVGPAVAFPGAL